MVELPHASRQRLCECLGKEVILAVQRVKLVRVFQNRCVFRGRANKPRFLSVCQRRQNIGVAYDLQQKFFQLVRG